MPSLDNASSTRSIGAAQGEKRAQRVEMTWILKYAYFRMYASLVYALSGVMHRNRHFPTHIRYRYPEYKAHFHVTGFPEL